MALEILVVEDDASIREMVTFVLEDAGFQVKSAGDAFEARGMLEEHLPDLVLMDWMMPGMTGLEFTRLLKRKETTAHLPIIMLTVRGDDGDKVLGLEGGADDYITKPFSPKELVARIRAVARRGERRAREGKIEYGALSLDPASRRVRAGGKPVDLRPVEFNLLSLFVSNPERVFSREELLNRVWGRDTYIEDRTIDVHIYRLRKVLRPFGIEHYLQTLAGAGYRFSKEEP